MFLSLLGITFLVSFIVCFIIARLFTKPIINGHSFPINFSFSNLLKYKA